MSQPFQPEDLYLHRKVLEVRCSPQHDLAAATVRSVDRQADGYIQQLWLFPLDGGEPRQWTQGGSDHSPRWSPDGQRLAFISGRGGSAQVHLLHAAGGEAQRCGELPRDVNALWWMPDGCSLLVSAPVAVDPELRGARGAAPKERGPKSPELVWRLPYKNDGMGYLLAREVHLFRLDLATGQHRQLTDGPFDVLGAAPSPDGRQLACARTRSGRFGHRTDLWLCDAEGQGMRQLTADLASVLQPVWSPDGRQLAFAGARQEADAQYALYLCDVQSGELRQLADSTLEVADPQSLLWTEDGELYFTRAWQGCHQVCAVSPQAGALRVLVEGERQFGAFTRSRGHLAYSVDQPAAPSELWACGRDGEGERQVSQLNPWWAERTPLQAERRRFEVPDGRGGQEAIDGWLMRAQGATGPLPLLDDVHGGPAAYALLDFDTNVFWQVLCAQGWAVLALNAVGSASYGRDFCRRLAGQWGTLDLPQHLAAIQQLQREGVCAERVAISGKSYGGYLSAWAVGHTQLFRAAVVMAPVGNIETHFGTSDGGYYADPRYMASAPDFDRERARALSPLQHIEKSRTPVLFLQGKEDERCPKCQSEEMFVSLMHAGDTPAELVLYPGEDHHFLGQGAPSCRRDAAQRIIDWLRRWVLAAGGASPAL